MATDKIQRALISVYDKTGIVEFARALVDEFGIEIISTGGTASLLRENAVPVTMVEEVTGFPEMMDGRVKTLHPKIHAGILADRDNPDHMRQLEEQGIQPIDMVVVNLYPFEETVADPDCTFEQAIEMIDIGGPSMLRAAAKNHEHVLPVSMHEQYEFVLSYLRGEELPDGGMEGFRRWLASEVFSWTQDYDDEIAAYLCDAEEDLEPAGLDEEPEESFFEDGGPFLDVQEWEGRVKLTYGENPHQRAIYALGADGAEHGEWVDTENRPRPSFNNFGDASAALGLCRELVRELGDGRLQREHAAVFIKHTNACGVGLADDPLDAYRRAYLGDPNAAMGGILACGFEVDVDLAQAVMETFGRWGKEAGAGGFFVEVWIAPAFHDDALEVIRTTKKWGERVRLFAAANLGARPEDGATEHKAAAGGALMQDCDLLGLNEDEWEVATKRSPSDSEMADLRLAWLTCKHTKSNAITVCKDNMLIGNGAGQMSRVMSCRIATWLAKENGHAKRLSGSVAASDAFFPFRDGPDILMDAGVTAIIQPGGSKRDQDTIDACNERDVAMIFTGTRHFKH